MAQVPGMKEHFPYALVLVLLALTSLGLNLLKEPALEDACGVSLPLPARIGEHGGHAVLFCQNMDCRRYHTSHDLGGAPLCLQCGAPLGELSPRESARLPKDITVSRKEYRDAGAIPILATVVVNGRERTGLHRPQMCLEGQGFRIVAERTREIPLEGREPLTAAFLDLSHSGAAPDMTRKYVVAYWYATRTHETSSHWARQGLLAWDMLIHGRFGRWCFISLMMECEEDTLAAHARLTEFIARLYPLIAERS